MCRHRAQTIGPNTMKLGNFSQGCFLYLTIGREGKSKMAGERNFHLFVMGIVFVIFKGDNTDGAVKMAIRILLGCLVFVIIRVGIFIFSFIEFFH